MNRSRNRLITLVEFAAFGGLILVLANLQWLQDQYALATFHPSPLLAKIEARLGLTPAARAILYRAKPQIDSKAAFNIDCQTTKGELELGCFTHNRIYILQIDNPSLQPEMDVVTAHELLHASWDRLSSANQAKLAAELKAIYDRSTDQDLHDRMADYAKSEPGQQANELHSILGTETAVLGSELERQFRLSFVARAQLVAAHSAYQSVFSTRRQELATELATIRNLKAQLATMNRQMEQYRTSGQIASYNALVPRQNSLVDSINHRIDVYTTGVTEYNALSKSLDSRQITDTESGVSQ